MKAKYIIPNEKTHFKPHFMFINHPTKELVPHAKLLTPDIDDRFWEPTRVGQDSRGRFTSKRKAFSVHEITRTYTESSYCQACFLKRIRNGPTSREGDSARTQPDTVLYA